MVLGTMTAQVDDLPVAGAAARRHGVAARVGGAQAPERHGPVCRRRPPARAGRGHLDRRRPHHRPTRRSDPMTNPTSPATPGSAALPGSDSATARSSAGAAGRPLAVVTGASSGIGAATAAPARRRWASRSSAPPAGPTGSRRWPPRSAAGRSPATSPTPTTSPASRPSSVTGSTCWSTTPVARWASAPVAHDRRRRLAWRCSSPTCVGTLQVTQALLPGAGRVAAPAPSSTSARSPGRSATRAASGYTAAKHAVAVLTETLRLELRRPAGAGHGGRARDGAHRGVLADPVRRRPGAGRYGVRRGVGAVGGRGRRRRDRAGWSRARPTSTSTCSSSSRAPRPLPTRCTASPEVDRSAASPHPPGTGHDLR